MIHSNLGTRVRARRWKWGAMVGAAGALLAASTVPAVAQPARLMASSKAVTISLYTFTGASGPSIRDESAILREADSVIKAKTGVTVDFHILPGSSYGTTVSTMLAARSPIDLVFYATWMGGPGMDSLINADAFRPLNGLLAKYGKGILAVKPTAFEQSQSVDGKIYDVTTFQTNVLDPDWEVMPSALKAAGINPGTLKGQEDTYYLPGSMSPDWWYKVASQAVANTHGGIIKQLPPNWGYALGYGAHGEQGVFDPMAYGYWGVEGYDSWYPFFVKMGTTQVSIPWAAFAQYIDTMHKAYAAGWEPADAGTNAGPYTTPVWTDFAYDWTGAGFIPGSCVIDGIGPCLTFPMSPRPFYMGGPQGGWEIPTSARHPVAAMEVLNLFYTDPSLITLLSYGLPNKDYTVKGGVVTYTKNSGWYYAGSCWMWGNCFITPTWPYAAGGPMGKPGFWAAIQKWNEFAVVDPLSTFIFNPRPVSAAWADIESVDQHYEPLLFTGSETDLSAWKSALMAAGAQKVQAAIQSQLNAYLAHNPAVKKEELSLSYQKLMSMTPVYPPVPS